MSEKRLIEFNGVKRSLSEWAFILGFSKQRLHQRLQRYSIDVAFNPKTGPVGRGKKLDAYFSDKPMTDSEKEIIELAPIEKIDGLSDIIASSHADITRGLFSDEEMRRLQRIKDKRLKDCA